MTENQKLREALQVISHIDDTTNHSVDASAALDRIGQIARQALALPTAEQVDDINVAESFTSVTKTAAPVGERDRFESWWRSVQLMTFPKEYDIERLQDWGSIYKPKALEAWQARASLSAGDAVDAQRYRWLADCNNYEAGLALIIDPKLTEQALGAAIDAAMRKGKP